MSITADLVVDAKAHLGEGPIWDAQKQVLYWVNIMGDEVHIYDPATKIDRAIPVGQHVGTVVSRASGGLILALHHGFASLDVDTGKVEIINDPEAHLPNNRFNDGQCDPAGRLWAGTMALDEAGATGSLYMLDTDLSVHKMLDNVSISNGICWSADNRTMYFIDTPLGTVDAFDFDLETGAISNRRSIITIPDGEGYPDGMTIDSEGMLWVAHWAGFRITQWNPATGEKLQTVHAAAPNTSACAFGGKNLDELYISTARHLVDEAVLAEYPHTGGLFMAKVDAQGVEAFEFNG